MDDFAALAAHALRADADAAFVANARDATDRQRRRVRTLLTSRTLPADGWHANDVERLVRQLAALDSNAAEARVGVGEREARVFSQTVARRHFGLAHGVGRSGDVAAVQPKALGSSTIGRLAHRFALQLARDVSGLSEAKAAVVVPVATGMSLALTMLALRAQRPRATRVVWSRIDQKACFKSILTAALQPHVVELRRAPQRGDAEFDDALAARDTFTNDDTNDVADADRPVSTSRQRAKQRKRRNAAIQRAHDVEHNVDALCTDVDAIERAIVDGADGADGVLCVLTTTSCFAPRVPDDVVAVARVCARLGVPHVINNAYGLQTRRACAAIARACRVGRVDAIVQSTDKNLLVPVGGAIVMSPNAAFVDEIAQTYAGRGNGAPALDVFITALEMGRNGYRALVDERERLFVRMRERLTAVASKHGERVLETRTNEVSLAMTLANVARATRAQHDADVTFFGAQMFARQVSGSRVVDGQASKTIGPHSFVGWGGHCDAFGTPYMTVAVAVGMTEVEVDTFCERLDKLLTKALATANKQTS